MKEIILNIFNELTNATSFWVDYWDLVLSIVKDEQIDEKKLEKMHSFLDIKFFQDLKETKEQIIQFLRSNTSVIITIITLILWIINAF